MMILKYLHMNKMMYKLLVLLLVFSSTVAHAQLTQPEWSKNAVMYEVNVRQYSQEGTFKAVTKDLTRIKGLGVDVLWIMPIHPIYNTSFLKINESIKLNISAWFHLNNYKYCTGTVLKNQPAFRLLFL